MSKMTSKTNSRLSNALHARAEVELRRAMEMRAGLFGEHHSSVGESLAELGRLRRQQGRPDEATELLERALSVQTAALPIKHPTVQNLKRELGLRGDAS